MFVRRSHPHHPIFRDALFTTAEYASFATAVDSAADTLCHKDPHLVAIAKAIPSVNERLRSITSVIQTRQATHAIALAQVMGALNELTGKLNDFLTGSFSLTFTPRRSRMLPGGYDPAGQPYQHTPPSPLDLNVRQPAVDLGGPPPLAPTALDERAPAWHYAIPTYHLSRQVTTVPELWRE